MTSRWVQTMLEVFGYGPEKPASSSESLPDAVEALRALQEARKHRVALEKQLAESQQIVTRLKEHRDKNNFADVFERAIRGGSR